MFSFWAFKSPHYTNVHLLWQFPLKDKGVTYERVHTDIGLYMCVYNIQRYDDVMKEKGGEGREKKKWIYIYI